MKISIGINGFKEYNDLEKREKLCIDSLCKIKNKIPNITLYNICFTDENINYKNFITLNSLTLSSNKIIKDFYTKEGMEKEYELLKNKIDNNTKKLPIIKEIFDILASTDCDYFVFLNNDIILSDRIFKEITSEYEAYTVSRVNIKDIVSLNDIPELLEYCVHGFDAFVIKRQTWLDIRNNFEDFILGRFYWDTFTATLLNLFCKCKNLNKLPPVCFHIDHPNVSAQDTIENRFCEYIFKSKDIINYLWFNYVYNVLFKRQSAGQCKWYYPLQNEEQIEKQHFNQISKISKLYKKEFSQSKITSKNEYDVFIPVAPKDELKLPYVLESVFENLTPKKVYICSPHNIQNKLYTEQTVYINDKDIINITDKTFIKFRPNWTYQQFLKLFFSQGESDYFFVLDSDSILLKKINLFKDQKPIWYYGANQNHLPYFLFNKKIFNINKTLKHTGIGDTGLFNKHICNTILKYTGCKTPEELLYIIGNNLNSFYHFSEYEFYSNFVNTYYPGFYIFEQFNQYSQGRNLDNGEDWNVQAVESAIKEAKINNKTILTLHSWKI